ncbi:MAG TPA: hypothetical protein VMU15_19470 [Anaeromyxobacter sp.]|nr:hypothetical protein [Anaeromyxobacter sp.]
MTWASLDATGVRGQVAAALAGLARIAAWVRAAGPVAGIVAVAGGAVALVAADRLRRSVAFLGGAGAGALAAIAAGPWLSAWLPPAGWAWLGAVLAGVASALAPPLFPALLGALVGAHLGIHAPVAGRPAVGGAIGAAVGAAILLMGARSAAAVLACLAGGVALGLGLLALAGARPPAAELAGSPVAVLCFAVVTGIAGAAYQLGGGRERGRNLEPPRLPRE